MKRLDYFYVGLQLTLFLVYILLPNKQISLPSLILYCGGILSLMGLIIIAIAILQLNKNLSPFPSPKLNSSLITNGLYGIVRHPIYSGILLACLGYALYQESIYKVLVTIALSILFHFKASYEESMLENKFPEYADYKKRTGKIFPHRAPRY